MSSNEAQQAAPKTLQLENPYLQDFAEVVNKQMEIHRLMKSATDKGTFDKLLEELEAGAADLVKATKTLENISEPIALSSNVAPPINDRQRVAVRDMCGVLEQLMEPGKGNDEDLIQQLKETAKEVQDALLDRPMKKAEDELSRMIPIREF